jgi:hypothetical protein
MGHSLIALVVKAVNEKEAEEKAWHTLENVICGEDGIVVGSMQDLERENPDTYRWIPPDKTRPAYEALSYIRISPVDSCEGQKLINTSYPPTDAESQRSLENYEMRVASYGYFCRDEEGICISDQNDRRLHSKDYFVVPVDVYS